MKVRTSYFYQIRFFPRNYIPMSTCLSDPKWFHDFKDPNYIFKDKRGVINGLRLRPIIVQGNNGNCSCPCEEKDPSQCPFVKNYEFELNLIDFDKMYRAMNLFCADYCKQENIQEEPVAVLIVYETPENLCSERKSIQNLFINHGIECKELDYPINNRPLVKEEPFEF